VESLGKVWLFTIAQAQWRPGDGHRVAKIGPLPVTPGTDYTAVYLEVISEPGRSTPVHKHSGPEAFYTLTGEICLETPAGVFAAGADASGPVVQADTPMELTATGPTRRRGIALILHDSSRPAMTFVDDWTPKGLCKP
jgi:anti-sigma factor ChrR (cupin superfamily)